MKSRNFGLDLVRCISIWLVLISHLGVRIPGIKPLTIGGIGVEVFFVLSGFLIGGILIRQIDKEQGLWDTLKSFWVRRWYRILPLYYLAITLKFLLVDDSIGWNILYYVFFLQNNFFGVQFYSVTWSLVIEEWFYLFAPFYLYLTMTILKSNMKVLWAIVGFILFVIISRGLFVFITDVPYSGINGNFPFRFDSLFLGVLLAFVRIRFPHAYAKLERPKFAVGGMLLIVVYLGLLWRPASEAGLVDSGLFYRTFGYFILPFSMALMIPYCASWKELTQKSWRSKLFFQIVTRTSLYTYALYLTHSLVLSYLHGPLVDIGSYGLEIAAFIALSYALSAVIYHGFEKPILNLRDRGFSRTAIFAGSENKSSLKAPKD